MLEKFVIEKCEKLRVTILGSSSFIPTIRRSWTSLFLDLGEGDRVLVDAGSWRLLTFRNDVLSVNRIYVSHRHHDHIGFIGAIIRRMCRKDRTEPLIIFCPPSAFQPIHHFIRIWNYNKVPSFVQIRVFTPEIPRKIDYLPSSKTEIRAAAACHTTPTAGYAFHQGTTRVVITTDTGPRCPTLLTLAEKAAVWFHDCTFATGWIVPKRKGHSTPQNAGADAARAKIQTLILTHISGIRLINKRAVMAAARLHFNGKILIANDDMTLTF